MMADHPNGADFRGDSEVSRVFTRGEHFEWADAACMIKANEGVLHTAGECLTDVMLTDSLVMYRRIMTLTEF